MPSLTTNGKKRGRPFSLADGIVSAVTIPKEWDKFLARLAEKEDTTKSALIRKAMKEHFKLSTPDPNPTK